MVLLCFTCFFNDGVIRQNFMVRSHLPATVFGILMLYVLVVNPLLRMVHRRLALSGGEVATVLVLVLIACAIPGTGCAQILPNIIMLPHYFSKTEPGWTPAGLLGLVPSRMLGDPSSDPDAILTGFVRGMDSSTKLVSPLTVPWHGWTTTLCF